MLAAATSSPALTRFAASRQHTALAWRPLRTLGLITLVFWTTAVVSYSRAPLLLDAVALAAVAAVGALLLHTSRRLGGSADRSGLIAFVKDAGSPRTGRLRGHLNAVGQLGLFTSVLLLLGWTVPEILGDGNALITIWPLLVVCNVMPVILLSTLAIVDTVSAVRAGSRLRLVRAALALLAAIAFVALTLGSPLVTDLGAPLASTTGMAVTPALIAIFYASGAAGVAASLVVLYSAPALLASVVGVARDLALRSAVGAYEKAAAVDKAAGSETVAPHPTVGARD